MGSAGGTPIPNSLAELSKQAEELRMVLGDLNWIHRQRASLWDHVRRGLALSTAALAGISAAGVPR